MGYYTNYNLKIIDGDNELIVELTEENEEAGFAFDVSGETRKSTKWYEHETHLREFSKNHPEALFKLGGTGEEARDLWFKYFRNGKMQLCEAEIIIPPFNAELLK